MLVRLTGAAALLVVLTAFSPTAAPFQKVQIEPPVSVVTASVMHELGDLRGGYLYPDGLVREQVLEGMGIPDPTAELGDGNLLLSGCRRHSCDEKAAVVVNRDGKMLAAGLIYFDCWSSAAPRADCLHTPRLAVFARPGDSSRTPGIAIEAWGLGKGAHGIETILLQ